jgi:hypothetical protein
MRGDRTRRDLTWPQNGLAVSRKNRPHIDRNLFAIHPVTNSEDFNFQAWQCAVTRCFVSYAEFDGA